MSLPEIQSRFTTMASISQFADVWTDLMLQCNGWDVYAQNHPATSPKPWPQPDGAEQIETSFPILFLSNTLDPVTPLSAAVEMALKFKHAGLLEQKAEGHCTVSASSRCTARVVRDYLLDGKVPPPPKVDGKKYLQGTWQTCEAESSPFEPPGRIQRMTFEDEEKRLVEAFDKVREVMDAAPRWGKLDERGLEGRMFQSVMAKFVSK